MKHHQSKSQLSAAPTGGEMLEPELRNSQEAYPRDYLENQFVYLVISPRAGDCPSALM